MTDESSEDVCLSLNKVGSRLRAGAWPMSNEVGKLLVLGNRLERIRIHFCSLVAAVAVMRYQIPDERGDRGSDTRSQGCY
ncbi:hypothetical protein STRCI_008552 [Streptomyces cinnabarinus]|uniref:Transposase n=1 Tax=Streptomyces cinnabarinus TaxID=67287 RepID=A0ABY7KTE3_9ACTN|nr:hypothetical protein [Streptomyces cinnabarinus]WAZ26885.1 hypothetical protein STRCI_008552 [Streptomyces cinnabarinus]